MRAPNDKPKRKTADTKTASDRARAKLAALGWDAPSIEQYIEGFSEEVLNALFPKLPRGRPRLPSWDDILPSWADILAQDVCFKAEAMNAFERWQRQHQGRPPDQERNQSLKDGYLAAKSQGVTMRNFAKQWFRERHGREPTEENVGSLEQQIGRLLKK